MTAAAAWAVTRDAGLHDHLAYAYERAPAVRALLDRAAVDPRSVHTVADLAALPVTSKDDLVRLQADDPPFGGFCAVPMGEVSRIYVSPGPLYEPGSDQRVLGGSWLHDAFAVHGMPRTGRALISFSYHLVPAGLGFDGLLRRYGLTTVPAGVGNTDVQARVLRDLGVTVFAGTPSFFIALVERAEQLGYRWGEELQVRFAVIGAEAFTTPLRREFARRGVTAIQTYGAADVGLLGCTCPESTGFHLTDQAVVEIVDPATGRPVAAGEVGEVVVTPFNPVYPLVRFGTGDLARLLPEPCACGLAAPVLSRLVGRIGQGVKVRGMFLYPHQVEEAMGAVPGVARYQLAVRRNGHRDELVVRLESPGGDGTGVAERVTRRGAEVWRVRPDRVETVPIGTLPEGGKVLVDERPWDG